MNHTTGPFWLVLPTTVRKRLEDRTSDNLLPSSFISTILDGMQANPEREEELLQMAKGIDQYLKIFPKGWGEWPSDTKEAIYVGLLLGMWFNRDIEEQLVDLPEKDLAFLEAECRKREVSTEQYLFDRLVEARES